MEYKQLTSEQRYTLKALLRLKTKKKVIAATLGVDRSTVYREIKRNGGNNGGYDNAKAQARANLRRQRLHLPRTYTIELRREVHGLLRKLWSPRQISGWLLREKGIRLSHETIYADIRADRQAGGDLWKFCRHSMKHRKRPVGKCPQIPDRVGIERRSAEADGTRFGDWEMDTIIGKNGKGAILTLTERSTNFSMAELLPAGKDAKQLAKPVVRLLTPYMGSVYTVTTDNGGEFAEHKYISERLHTTVFFAHSYSSWEKGTIMGHRTKGIE